MGVFPIVTWPNTGRKSYSTHSLDSGQRPFMGRSGTSVPKLRVRRLRRIGMGCGFSTLF
jgi:hypothetical protein